MIATSQADPTKSGTLAVTVNAVTVSVTAASATVFPGLTDQFTATVTGPRKQRDLVDSGRCGRWDD